jgi:AcrR family transcriptional regulator
VDSAVHHLLDRAVHVLDRGLRQDLFRLASASLFPTTFRQVVASLLSLSLPLPPDLLAAALACFAQHGLRTTSTPQLAAAAGLSHGRFYRLIGSKDALLEAVYASALAHLAVELPPAAGDAPAAGLQGQLARWWHVLAQQALAHPDALAFWRRYRSSGELLGGPRPDLGPFVPLLAAVGPVLATLPAGAAPAFSPTLLAELLAAQWLAALEVVLTNPGCRAQPALRTQVLRQAYAGWWVATGLPGDTPAIPT